MLPKKNRVVTKEVERIFKEGSSLSSPSFTFRYFKNNDQQIKVSFIAPKAIAKTAVKRNRLRRIGYSVLKSYINHFPLGIRGVFVFKKHQDDISTISNEIKTIRNKIN